jgi:hypothetical protein
MSTSRASGLCDLDIRHALRARVLARHLAAPHTLVIEEMNLEQGRGRVDLAVIGRRFLHGYEIKSERDTLLRLPGQIRVYSRVLDFVTMVVHRRHLAAVQQLVPRWWGLKVVDTGTRGAVRVARVRRARLNPAPVPVALARLLWHDELLRVAKRLKLVPERRYQSCWELSHRLINAVPVPALRRIVRHQLQLRGDWHTDPLPFRGPHPLRFTVVSHRAHRRYRRWLRSLRSRRHSCPSL